MKKILKAILVTTAVVLVVIAFIAPSSAYSLYTVSYTDDGTDSIWTYTVTCDTNDPNAISNWVVAWCNERAVKEVWVDGKQLFKDVHPEGWDYSTFYGVQGIQIDYSIGKGYISTVIIKLAGVYGTGDVEWRIKSSTDIYSSTVWGPVVCATPTPEPTPIPEFSTIAIPIASLLGLLLFFNRRKRRREQ